MVYYTDCAQADLVPHFCDECGEPELGGIRAVALIDKDYAIAAPATAAEWITGINAGNIEIIPATRGNYDGGTPNEGPGYGDQKTRSRGKDHVLTFFDPDLLLNYDFYNVMQNNRNKRIAYVTEKYVWMTNKAASWVPGAPVEEDVSSDVTWNVQVKWSDSDLPKPYVKPLGVFECFALP